MYGFSDEGIWKPWVFFCDGMKDIYSSIEDECRKFCVDDSLKFKAIPELFGDYLGLYKSNISWKTSS